PAREQGAEGARPRSDQRAQAALREIPRTHLPRAGQERSGAPHRPVRGGVRDARHDQLDLPVVQARRASGRDGARRLAHRPVPGRSPEACARGARLKTARAVGIAGYGACIPRPRIATRTIALAWGRSADGRLPVREKSVPSADEDTVTM